jgi:hypothetical protein
MINTESQRELLQIELAKQGCDCQDCRGYAWDKVKEKEEKMSVKLDEYDGELVAGVRYANSFTRNLAILSRDAGAKEERERIIKLLEPYANSKCDELCVGRCDCFAKYEAEHFIALIMGKNK